MNAIPDETLWLEIHRVFRGRDVSPHGSLTLKELMEAWPDSGLRQNDLAQGLESLGRAGFVRLEMTPQGPSVRLLDAQFGAALRTVDDDRALDLLAAMRKPVPEPEPRFAERSDDRDGRRIDDATARAA